MHKFCQYDHEVGTLSQGLVNNCRQPVRSYALCLANTGGKRVTPIGVFLSDGCETLCKVWLP